MTNKTIFFLQKSSHLLSHINRYIFTGFVLREIQGFYDRTLGRVLKYGL